MSDSSNSSNAFPKPPDSNEFLVLEDSRITEEDRQEILSQIDTVVEENRIPITEELFRIHPQKRGSLFPILLNIITLVLIAGGVLFMFRFFQERQESLSLETREFLSTEGKLIEELRKESEEQLAQKEGEIQKIQDELTALDEESRALQENMEENIKEREDELRLELEAELQAERERLQGQGVSQEEIEAQLEALEAQRRAEFNNQLAAFREESQTELDLKEQELAQARDMAEQILDQANQERAQIEEETKQREAELRHQFEEEREALESRSSEAEAKLQELAEFREREGLINDQIIGSYAEIIDEIQAGNIEAANTSLSELKRFLQDPAIQTLPSIANRRNVEFFIIENIQDNLETKAATPAADTKSLLEAANLVVTARNIVEKADSAVEAGDPEEAKRLYTKALEAVPVLNQAYRSIRTIEENQSAGAIRRVVTAAREVLQEGNREEALTQYRQAALMSAGVNEQLASDAVTGIERVFTLNNRDDVDAREEIIADHENMIGNQVETIGGLETDVQERNETITGLEADIRQGNDTITERNNAIAALESIIEDGKETITDLETQVTEQTNSITLRENTIKRRDETILEQKDLIDEYEGTIGTGGEEIQYLNSTLEQNKTLIAQLQSDISEREERLFELEELVESLKSEVTDEEGMIAELREELESKNKEIEKLRTDKTAIENLTDTVGERNSEVASLKLQVAELGDQLKIARGSISNNDAARLRVSGKEEAYDDVLEFIAYISGRKPDSVKRDIEEKADEDAMYRNIIEEIRKLAATSITTDEAVRVTETKLIGTIASVTAGRVVIEPLVNIPIAEGSRILIKRRTSSGEVPIAVGEVYNVAAGRISANINKRISATRNPMVMDLVYMEVENQ